MSSNQNRGAPNVGQPPEPEAPSAQPPGPEVPRLFNPFNDGAKAEYLKIKTPEGTMYKHASAGKAVEKEGQEKPLWQRMRKENNEKYDGCRWGRWGTKAEWDDARWMATSKSSQAALEELLKTERVSCNHE